MYFFINVVFILVMLNIVPDAFDIKELLKITY